MRLTAIAALLACLACHTAPQAPAPRPPQPVDCGPAVAGAHELRGRLTLVGEVHGTEEGPDFVARLACALSAGKEPLLVGLEIARDEQARVDDFVAGRTGRAEVLAGDWWARGVQDGRNSIAMLKLIERLRALRASGRDVAVTLIDVTSEENARLDEIGRDRSMAERIAETRRRGSGTFLVLVGNLHAKLTPGTPWDDDMRPTGHVLAKAGLEPRSIRIAESKGTAWLSTPDGAGPTPLHGEAPTSPVNAIAPTTGGDYTHVVNLGRSTASPPAASAP